MRRSVSFLALFIATAALPHLIAGGANQSITGIPIVWNFDANGPIPIHIDRGMLASHDSATSYAIIQSGIEFWDTIPTADFQASIAGYLDREVTSPTDPYIFGASSRGDGIVPVVFDNSGEIIDAYIGAGSSGRVGGFATVFVGNDGFYTDGMFILNGKMDRNANGYRSTTRHELGHLFGFDHSQYSLLARYPQMYPSSGGDYWDEFRVATWMYPSEGALDSLGEIVGTITDGAGRPISGVNVVAIDSATDRIYSTVSDYYSGTDPQHRGFVQATGTYRFHALPPGNYYLHIEGIQPGFTGGSSVGSYDPPINIDVVREWYNGDDESAAMLVDNVNHRSSVGVEAGSTVENIDFLVNDSVGFAKLSSYASSTRHYRVPDTYQGAQIRAYAERFVAPFAGAPVLASVYINRFPQIREDGSFVVTLYENESSPTGDVPGAVVDSVVIPSVEMVPAHVNPISLFDILPDVEFRAGEIFHIGVSVNGPGRFDLQFDRSEGESGASYLDADHEWVPFPVQGNNDTRNGRIKMDVLFAPLRSGERRSLITFVPDTVDFGMVELGLSPRVEVELHNNGSSDIRVDSLAITGADPEYFRYDGSTIQPGTIVRSGQAFTVDVSFSPSEVREYRAYLELNGDRNRSALLIGRGKPATIRLVTPSLEFPQTLIDSTNVLSEVVLYHGGTTPTGLQISEIGDDEIDMTSPGSSVLFRPGDSLRVDVAFTPNAKGDFQKTLEITFSPARDTFRIEISGEGVDVITGVSEEGVHMSGKSILRIDPNPADDYVEVVWGLESSGRSDGTVTLYNATGQVVLRVGARNGSAKVALGQVPSGWYRVVVRKGNRVHSGALIIR